MNEKKSHTKVRLKRYRFWILISICVLLFVVGIRLTLKSDWLLDRVRVIAERQANAQINGNLTLERIEGDLLYEVMITGIHLAGPENEVLLTADSVRVSYLIWDFIRQPYELGELSLFGLKAEVKQFEDQSWNFEKLLADREEVETSDGVEWMIGEVQVSNSSLFVSSPSLPDESVSINGLDLSASNTGYRNEEWLTDLRMMNFTLDETRLNQQVQVNASATIDEADMTLEKMVVNTGRTILNSHIRFDQQSSELDGSVDLQPLSWRDIAAYSEIPLEQDLNVSLGLRGSLSDLGLDIRASADGLRNLSVQTSFDLENRFSMRELLISIEGFDGPRLTGNEQVPVAEFFQIDGEGAVYAEDPETSHFTAQFSANSLSVSGRQLDELDGRLNWDQSQATLSATVRRAGQSAGLTADIENLFSDSPGWKASMEGKQINLATWTGNEDLASDLTFTAEASGRGFSPSEELIRAEVVLLESRWGDQPIDRMALDVNLTDSRVEGLIQGRIGESRFHGDFSSSNWQSSQPDYLFTAGVEDFNLSDLARQEGFPTNLNAALTGRGSGLDLEHLELESTVRFDSSYVNGEPIQMLEADMEIRDQVLHVLRAELQSPIAEGEFSLRQHLVDFRHRDNRLDLEAEIKDLSSLSPLFGVETIQARGSLDGRMVRQPDGMLRFEGKADVMDLAYDTLYTAERLSGNVDMTLFEQPELNLDLDIDRPAVGALSLQSIRLTSHSILQDSLTEGSLMLTVMEDEENFIRYGGNYQYREDDIQMIANELVLQTPLRALTLQQPFELTWKSGVFRMDPLRIATGNGEAHLQLTVPYLDEERQELDMNARLLNLGVIQRTLLNDTYADALLSGDLSVQRVGTEINADSELLFTEIRKQEASMDSLRIGLSVQNGRMQVSSSAWNNLEELYAFTADVPFEPADPMSLGDEFFEQPVEGKITMNRSSLRYWNAFLADITELEADGFIRFDAEIGGTAGNPEFTGALGLGEGRISGVNIDSIRVDIDYRHEEREINFDGFVESLDSRVASFESTLPLHIDLRRFRVDLPDDTDEIHVSVITDSFDLALLNNFLDREKLRNLRGSVSSNIELNGTLAKLEPEGKITLTDGSIRVVPAGITLRRINSEILLNQNQILLQSFSTASGPGEFTASGDVDLANMRLGNINIQMNANQFSAANTSDINAVLDFNGSLAGTLRSPELKGTVQVRSGFVFLDNFGDRAIEEVQLDEDDETQNIALYDSTSIAMDVEFDRQFFIRNRQYLDMEVELEGTVDLLKNAGEELQMFGSVEGVEGYARPLGRNFELEDGVVTFYGPIDDPELNIRTLYRPPQRESDIRIWYVIAGTVQDPEFSFESDPQLELQDIISYTIFGQPFYALDSWKQVVATSGSNTTAADVAFDVLLDRVEMLATQQLGIDVVQIDNSRTASGSTTSIKTGWYLNERTFFAILNEIHAAPKTLFILEYLLRENLELIVTQGDDSREGIDLRWSFDY